MFQYAVVRRSADAVIHAGGGMGRVSGDGHATAQVRVKDRGDGIEVERLPRALLEKAIPQPGHSGME